MKQAHVASIKPIKEELEEGKKYAWCACGLSATQPFCDGSHRGTDFTPVVFSADKSEAAFLCACKRTANAPYCDGTHAKLTDEEKAAAGVRSASGMPAPKTTPEEPTVEIIHELARNGLGKTGHHGEMGAMGVPGPTLPKWADIQLLTAQLATKPLVEEVDVETKLVVGPNAKRPLELDIPLFVSDMSFGALSLEAKTALARGAELAGTGICSGEGGMLPEEQQENGRYFYELASAKFGYEEALLERVQAFHFKGGQGAKTGTGGHLPAEKVTEKIAEVRGLPAGTPAVSPPTFSDLSTPDDFRRFGDRVREITGGIPIGMKMSANHIEDDIDFSLAAGVDYIILDGRGGGTGAAPLIFRDNISIPTIPALANAAIQAVGCVGARMCNTNNCPAGVATQKPELRARLDVDESAQRLARFLGASVELMQVMARACGHERLADFSRRDVTSFDRDLAEMAGIAFAGASPSNADS
jgi:CDGSH-type Zn-finger protein